MEIGEFKIGQDFWCGKKRWRCTDIGSRVVVAICLEPHDTITSRNGEQQDGPHRQDRSTSYDPTWFEGPPYAVAESVFDEHDMEGCASSENMDLQQDDG
jgi:hypothetical protein